ncbi:transposase [Cesiribacter andamanensis]|uniref:transposase n=1 Tax=Cesiribacter andamanensis TaxID=649507 RepID=UPI00373FD6B5
MCMYYACFPKKIALMKLVEEIKSHSSKWIKTKGEAFEAFSWQRGYGVFFCEFCTTGNCGDLH